MTNWQAIADEIERYATIPARGPEDILLRDIYGRPGLSRTRAERIFRGLVDKGILVRHQMVITEKGAKVMAHRLAEDKTLGDLAEAVKELT